MNMSTLIAISGPSASGKTTLVKRLSSSFPSITQVVTTTTRPRRPNESSRDYHFVSQVDFVAVLDAFGFLEWVVFNGHLYGITYKALYSALERAPVALVTCTPHACSKLARWCQVEQVNFRSVFITTEKEQLVSRLAGRQEETGICQAQRASGLDTQTSWVSMHNYDIVLEDAGISQAIQEVRALAAA